MFKLSRRSLKRLSFCHPDLQRVIKLAITRTKVDFTIVETKRSHKRQQEMLKRRLSQTFNSRHLLNRCDYKGAEIICCHAVDLAHWVDGQVRWDWPLYYELEPVIRACAKELKVPIEWGGNWQGFPDGPHWQLPWHEYPIIKEQYAWDGSLVA